MKKYSFDDHPEHKTQLTATAEKWIANALNCSPMSDSERNTAREHMVGLYQASNLEPPKVGLFVSSPLVGAVACSIASGAWWLRGNPDQARKLFGRKVSETELMRAVAVAARLTTERCIRSYRGEPVTPLPRVRAATYDATYAATSAATYDATYDATYAATSAATRAATRAATEAATRAATDAATRAATSAATEAATSAATSAATYDATIAATIAATDNPLVNFLINCATYWWKFWNGGNMWSGWVSYLSFFRHVAELPLDYSKFQHYEELAHFGPRFMHQKFWIISDRPEVIKKDARNRPHCADGPNLRWRDGVELYHLAGIRVGARHVSGQMSAKEISEERNAEVRRVLVDNYNKGDAGRYVRDLGAAVLHEDRDQLGHPRRLLRIEQLDDEPIVIIEVTNSTAEPDGSFKQYSFRVNPELRPLLPDGTQGEPQTMTCLNAIASGYGLRGEQYQLAVET